MPISCCEPWLPVWPCLSRDAEKDSLLAKLEQCSHHLAAEEARVLLIVDGRPRIWRGEPELRVVCNCPLRSRTLLQSFVVG